MMVTVGTIPKRVWAPKGENIEIDRKWING